jgi:hypothetical protein
VGSRAHSLGDSGVGECRGRACCARSSDCELSGSAVHAAERGTGHTAVLARKGSTRIIGWQQFGGGPVLAASRQGGALSIIGWPRQGPPPLLGRQLLISLSRASEVSNFDQTATKERIILHVRPAGAAPPSPRHPAARLKEPKSKATCVRPRGALDCSGFCFHFSEPSKCRGQVHHAPFGKGGQSKPHTSSGLKSRATEPTHSTQLHGGRRPSLRAVGASPQPSAASAFKTVRMRTRAKLSVSTLNGCEPQSKCQP